MTTKPNGLESSGYAFTVEDLLSLALFIIQRALKHMDAYLCERLLHLLDNSYLSRLFIEYGEIPDLPVCLRV